MSFISKYHLSIHLTILFCIFTNGNLPLAQEKRILTLSEAIDIALDKSFSTKSLGLRLESARYGLNAAKGRFKTNAELSLQTPNFIEQVSEDIDPEGLPVFNTRGTTRFQSTLNINQPLPTDGVFSLRSTLYHRNVSTFLTQTNEDFDRNEFYTSISLQFRQPLFTFNRLKAGFEKANLSFERTQKQFKRTELDIVFNVTQSFYNLYRAIRQVQIAETEVEQQKDSYELARKKFEAGLIPEVEALQMEVDYAQSQNDLLAAQGNLKRREDRFKQLIGMELTEKVAVATNFEYNPFFIDEAFALERALQNRTEIRELEIDKRLAEIAVKETDHQSHFRVDVMAYVDITGISDPNLSGNGLSELIESSFDDISRRPKNKGVTLNVSLPLWDWGVNHNEVAQSQASLEETELNLNELKKTVTREVRAAISQVKEALGRLTVLKKSEEIAQKSYDISLARFDNGDITSQELALDRERLTQAKTAYLEAYIAYQLAVADLTRKTLWDFENNRSLVEEL